MGEGDFKYHEIPITQDQERAFKNGPPIFLCKGGLSKSSEAANPHLLKNSVLAPTTPKFTQNNNLPETIFFKRKKIKQMTRRHNNDDSYWTRGRAFFSAPVIFRYKISSSIFSMSPHIRLFLTFEWG